MRPTVVLRARAARRDDDGFTLLEVIVSISILALVIGAVTVALFTVFAFSGATGKNISDSADAQVVSAVLTTDVKGAAEITTAAAPTSKPAWKCGPSTGTQLLGLEWEPVLGVASPSPSTYETVVSYLAVKRGRTWTLVRDQCTKGFSSIPASSQTVSSDICQPPGATSAKGCSGAQVPPSITPSTKSTSAQSGWTSAVGVTKVRFLVTEPGSRYTYALVGEPVSGSAPSGTTTVTPPPLKCGYATAGTGTYATQLCFVNFATYSYTAAGSAGCQPIKEGITGTPFSLSLRLCVQGGTESNLGTDTAATEEGPPSGWSSACSYSPAGAGSGVPPPPNPPRAPLCSDPSSADIVAVPFPTYTSAPTSEAFLGNNGFYTGVPGDPGLYTYLEGTAVTLYFKTIEVLDQNNTPATSWDLVTGDAESTDTTESITWSTCPTTGGKLEISCPASGTPATLHKLALVPNNPATTDYYGNACMNKNYTNTVNSWLRYGSLVPGGGTVFQHSSAAQEVECAAKVSSDKTGTVMLEAPEPSTLTVNMFGTGLQAIFLGFLL